MAIASQDNGGYYNPFGTTANPSYNPYAPPGTGGGNVSLCSSPAFRAQNPGMCNAPDKGGEDVAKIAGGVLGGGAGQPTAGGGAGPAGGPAGSTTNINTTIPGGEGGGPGAAPPAPSLGGLNAATNLGISGELPPEPAEQFLSGPTNLRQGIGRRNPPQLTASLAGLRRVY